MKTETGSNNTPFITFEIKAKCVVITLPAQFLGDLIEDIDILIEYEGYSTFSSLLKRSFFAGIKNCLLELFVYRKNRVVKLNYPRKCMTSLTSFSMEDITNEHK